MTHTDILFVCVIDEAVTDDPHGLITPQAQELLRLGETVLGGQAQAVVDTGQVTQVEDVVELGRCRRKVLHCHAVKKTEETNR